MKDAYDNGRRALRGSKAVALDPRAAANLLLLWLSGLPEPLFPTEHAPVLLASLKCKEHGRSEHLVTIRTLLKRVSGLMSPMLVVQTDKQHATGVPLNFALSVSLQTEPFIVEALYPLFELLHHYWINQPERQATLDELASIFAVPVFGTPQEHGLAPKAKALFVSATALLIAEYRPLFTQPYVLQRYEQDLARQAAAAATKQSPARGLSTPLDIAPSSSPLGPFALLPHPDCGEAPMEFGSPLLTPRRLSTLTVMDATGLFSPVSPDAPMDAFFGPRTAPEDAMDGDLAFMLDQLVIAAVDAAFAQSGPSRCAEADGDCLMERTMSPTCVVDVPAGEMSDGSESLDGSCGSGEGCETDCSALTPILGSGLVRHDPATAGAC